MRVDGRCTVVAVVAVVAVVSIMARVYVIMVYAIVLYITPSLSAATPAYALLVPSTSISINWYFFEVVILVLVFGCTIIINSDKCIRPGESTTVPLCVSQLLVAGTVQCQVPVRLRSKKYIRL